MPVIHECAPASPAAKKWHMANPPGVQLHACKCHNLKAATHFFWEAKKTPQSAGLMDWWLQGSLVIFFRYMDIMHTHQDCQKCKENNSSFQAISKKPFSPNFKSEGTVLVRIHLPAGHPSPRRLPIPRFTSLGGEVVFVCFCYFCCSKPQESLCQRCFGPFEGE